MLCVDGSMLSCVMNGFVQIAARRNTELHNVNANIKRKLIGRRQKFSVKASESDSDSGDES